MKYGHVAAAAALALCMASAEAGPIPAGGLSLNDVAAWLQKAGYKAEIRTDSDGKQNIYSGADGNAFHISMYDCKQNLCGSLQFWVGFDTKGTFTAAKVNEWNRKNRWTRSYIDDANDPWLEQDVDLIPGGSYENLDDEFAIWRAQLGAFHHDMNP
ncbi:MAG: YbjN domain-containing protein [Alphaproteobacteria bacterium]|nr:YbjN domain-containing protein [Alphaproteobacteria bacterium]